MQFFMQWPEQLQGATVFLVTLLVAGQINRGIYRLAWVRREIGPWSKPASKAPPRQWIDRVPILGWFFLQREEALHGKSYWIRPLLIELGLACGLTMLFFHVIRGQTLPRDLSLADIRAVHPTALYQLFFSHAALICLMTVATFIDFDEKTIPDAITGPGAMAGLLFIGFCPWARLVTPYFSLLPSGQLFVQPAWLQIAAPNDWPNWLNGWQGAAIGCGCLLAWCWAMVPTTCTLRRGVAKGIRYYVASFFRGHYWKWMLATAVIGCPLILGMWRFAPQPRWEALLTQLIGMLFGGMIVWSVRFCAGIALQREAMGFGDVTLMAMIGAFLGWQATLLVFFLSPVGALFVSVAQWLATRKRDIAFGPYLCLAAVFLMVGWPLIWPRVEGLFSLGLIVPALFAACLALMCGMLMLWRIIEDAIFSRADR